ncbi:hypothetical protein [Halopiger xanaduensis]|uniref:PIN domain-containing protein n=1 Tax=Halopiger xanaduensis (strain DSM 18323 / JCM 14033 / SH-6) TaxID=797210 RepID=F8DDV1_HALXS|nr:hypothetical protein [Halopiger xanaduensis]AEH39205.1 hypothetical protein Halxa_0616 [Halopiger xanaduensis SH-6]
MSSRLKLRTVVADTSALVCLAVPRADAAVDTDAPDPLQYLLTSCDVFVPSEVVAELHDITQYQDIYAAATSNVLAARGHYTARLIYDYARNGYMTTEAARTLLTVISPHRSWDDSPYVAQLVALLEQ